MKIINISKQNSCLSVVLRPNREYFIKIWRHNHGWLTAIKCLPMFGIYGLWAEGGLNHTTSAVTIGLHFFGLIRLIDWLRFYAVSAIPQSCNGGVSTEEPPPIKSQFTTKIYKQHQNAILGFQSTNMEMESKISTVAKWHSGQLPITNC